MNKKIELGQFYTTNYEYILQNMSIPMNTKIIIEPFAGNKDLLKFIKNKDDYKYELYDIEPMHNDIIKQDTLKTPPIYDDKFILTNPPYLARNKNKNKDIYNLYNTNDLYKCFITNINNSNCLGGIIIIPLNFICSIRKADIKLRELFLHKYEINILNIFEEKVFEDTSYSICSILFTRKENYNNNTNIIKTFIYPSKQIIEISLNKDNNYTIGGELYVLPYNKKIKIERATRLTTDINKENITNILLKTIDDNNKNLLGFKIIEDKEKDKYIDNTEKLSLRGYAILVINKKITLEKQELLVKQLNDFIKNKRENYNSLFLTNYRENKRKRISFELAFRICNYILSL